MYEIIFLHSKPKVRKPATKSILISAQLVLTASFFCTCVNVKVKEKKK